MQYDLLNINLQMERRRTSKHKIAKEEEIKSKEEGSHRDQYRNLNQDEELEGERWQDSERRRSKWDQRKEKQHKIDVNESIFAKKSWSTKEKIRLLVFLTFYFDLPSWRSQRRSIVIYKSLSIFLKTKTPEQCKNIHSLLKRKFRNFQQTLQCLRSELETHQNFNKMYSKYTKQIENFQEYNCLRDEIIYGEKKPFHSKMEASPNKPVKKEQVKQKIEEDYIINISPYIRTHPVSGELRSRIKTKIEAKSQEQLEGRKQFQTTGKAGLDQLLRVSEKRRKQLSEIATYHWKQYLLAMITLEQRKGQAGATEISKDKNDQREEKIAI